MCTCICWHAVKEACAHAYAGMQVLGICERVFSTPPLTSVLSLRYWIFVNEWLSLRVDALSRRSGRLVGVKLVCDMREADPLKQFRFCWLIKMHFVDLY